MSTNVATLNVNLSTMYLVSTCFEGLVDRVVGKMSSNNIKCNTTLNAKNSVVPYLLWMLWMLHLHFCGSVKM
jgi:hypothetical protein